MLSNKKIIVGHGHSSIEVCHSLVPLFQASKKLGIKFAFIDYHFKNLNQVAGDLLILVRKYHHISPNFERIVGELSALRRNFSKIIYFDDAAAVSNILFPILDYVDQYWVRGLLVEKKLYSKSFYGGHLFSDYYHNLYNILDDAPYFQPAPVKPEFDSKIKVAWNLGIGCFPSLGSVHLNKNYKTLRKLATASTILPISLVSYPVIKLYFDAMVNSLKEPILNFNKRKASVSARFSHLAYRKSIGYQRLLASQMLSKEQWALTGRVPNQQYMLELTELRGLLSPYGWGEICYRDFEAALFGMMLAKPDMSHIETWPNIYADNCYFPLDWDFGNLKELCHKVEDWQEASLLVENARKVYLQGLLSAQDRAISMISSVFDS